ncbi:MAG: hypothetical protein ACKOCU_01160 [Betaproteobacteria bacterium]
MTDFRVDNVRQTPWACGHQGEVWYACVHADVHDEVVINAAKRIVDKAIPQKLSTFFGGHYYSFVTREYLLNLLLFHYAEHEVFPSGSVCIVDRWVWDGLTYKHLGKWFSSWAWRFDTSRKELKAPGYWVRIPSLQSVMAEPASGTAATAEQGLAQAGVWRK